MIKRILFLFSIVVVSFTLIGCVDNEPKINLNDDCPIVDPIVCDVCDICPIDDQVLTCEFTDELFLEVLEILESNHFSEPSRELLIEGAIEGMINVLNDPFTSYFDSLQADSYTSGFGETYVGIGVTVQFLNELVVIKSVIANGPADSAGIRANDIITSVNGESALGQDFYEVIGKIIGDEGTEVTVGVVRNGVDGIIYFTMTRAIIDNPTVVYETYTVNNELIGYIKVNTFGAETATKFNNAIVTLEGLGIDSLIVDLRVNGGGYLSAVTNMLREFLVYNSIPMFSTETYTNGNVNRDDYYGTIYNEKSYDIVTLVNGNSASASEVFASAMQEHGRYKVIGVTTYGKGTMQTNISISAVLGDELHITIGKWFTSDDNWVHYDGGTDGVTPDIIKELNKFELAYKVFVINNEVIMYDTVDDRVANIQLILTIMDYDVRTDGYFDLDTKNAVMDIQTNNSLPVTGNLDSDTLEIINDALSVFQQDFENDSQLQAAIDYLLGN